jgi:serine/threonine protein kinase
MSASLSSLDRFQHLNPVGTGSFAVVKAYKVRETGEKVAIKSLKPDLVADNESIHRFEREIELLEDLSGHPNIVDILGKGNAEGLPFYVMPLATINLQDYIDRNNNKLTLKERIEIFDQVVEAIIFAHSKEIQHRDLGPANVLMYEEPKSGQMSVRVSDFGLGKKWSDDSGFTIRDLKNIGTFYYTPPEQHDGLGNVTQQGDIYSLGKLLEFILTGKKPVSTRITNGFKVIVERSTQGEPENRYADITEFQVAYKKIKDLTVLDQARSTRSDPTTFWQEDGQVDWKLFHRFAVEGEFEKSVYTEYLDVFVTVLEDIDNLRKYVEFAGAAVRDSLDTLERKLDDLPPLRMGFWQFCVDEHFLT